MKRTALILATALALVAALPAAASARFVFFKSPTGNIGCAVYPGEAECDINTHDWNPTRPSTCHLDYGDSIAVARSGKAFLVCHGDTTFDPGEQTLAYGRSVTNGGYRCSSAITGVTCTRLSNGHGFFISIQSYRLF